MVRLGVCVKFAVGRELTKNGPCELVVEELGQRFVAVTVILYGTAIPLPVHDAA